jgi:hypothetical protein
MSSASASRRLLAAALVALSVAGPAGAAVDHYLCYNMVPRAGRFLLPFPSTQVADVFGDHFYDMKARWQLCTPADVEEGGTTDAATHLVTFQLVRKPGEARRERRRNIHVTNALGELFVDTIKPLHILVPVSKGLTDYLPPPDIDTIGVDHYACYTIRTTAGAPRFPHGVRASVGDQFTSPPKTFALRKPRVLCAPAAINGRPAKNPAVYQLCYFARRESAEPAHQPRSGLKLATKFPRYGGPTSLYQVTLGTIIEDTLCVPSQVTLPPP